MYLGGLHACAAPFCAGILNCSQAFPYATVHPVDSQAPSQLVKCTVCESPELDRLIGAEPGLARQWEALPRRHLVAGDVVLHAGATVSHAWQVRQGLLRCYFLSEDGVERNKSFHREGDWLAVTFPGSSTPSPFAIEALEPVELIEVSQATLGRWMREFPATRAYIDEALNSLLHTQLSRQSELLLLNPEERYRSFLAAHEGMVERIPLHHVASYLGITSVSLSRIRARLGISRK